MSDNKADAMIVVFSFIKILSPKRINVYNVLNCLKCNSAVDYYVILKTVSAFYVIPCDKSLTVTRAARMAPSS